MTVMPRKEAKYTLENGLVSVVLSTYNERENLSNLIPIIERIFEAHGMMLEIVVVDDNSPDGTSSVARALGERYGNVRLLSRPAKLGPGSAHADGYGFARGEIIVGMDTDFSHNPYDIPKFVAKVEEGFDLVCASRYIPGGQYEVKSLQTLSKSVASRLGNIVIRFLTGAPVHDFTTAFRAMRRQVAQSVRTQSTGNSFFMEFVISSYRQGYKLTELPITFRDRVAGQSKLSLGKQSFRMMVDLLRLAGSR